MWHKYTGTHTYNALFCSVHSDTKSIALHSFLYLVAPHRNLLLNAGLKDHNS